jgi:hypothetical protein
MLGVSGRKPAAAFMRDCAGCLQQDEALLGLDGIDPAAPLVAGESEPVEVRVLAAQGELQSAFALAVSVTGPEVATGLAHHSHDVGAKLRRPQRKQQGKQEATLTQKHGHAEEKHAKGSNTRLYRRGFYRDLNLKRRHHCPNT